MIPTAWQEFRDKLAADIFVLNLGVAKSEGEGLDELAEDCIVGANALTLALIEWRKKENGNGD